MGAGGVATQSSLSPVAGNPTRFICNGTDYGRAEGAAGSTGGGSTFNGGVSSITNLDFLNSFWQINSCSVQGGNAGTSPKMAGASAGISGSGGAGGLNASPGQPGTAYCNGGGQGDSASNTATSNTGGVSASANTGSGGGSPTVLTSSATLTGGSGGSGLCVFYYVVA